MAKIVDYPKVNTVSDSDVFLVDGQAGTRTITVEKMKDILKPESIDIEVTGENIIFKN